MANTEKKTKDKIANLTEHLSILRADVSRTQEQYNDTLSKKNELEKEIGRKLADLAQREFEIGTKENRLSSLEDHLNKLSSLLQSREANLVSQEDEFSEQKQRIQIELENLESSTRAKIQALQDAADERLGAINSEVAKATDRLVVVKSSIETEQQELARVNTEVDRVTAELDSLLDKKKWYEFELSELQEEMEEQKELNQRESTKITEAHDGLAEREKIITRRERNFLTLKGRLDKVLQKLYPGQNIDNLL